MNDNTFTLRDFAAQSDYSICDPLDLLYGDEVTITNATYGTTYRHNVTGSVDLGGHTWGSFDMLLDLQVVGFNYDRRNHHLYIQVN